MVFNQTEKQERSYLQQIINRLKQIISHTDVSVKDHVDTLAEYKDYLWSNKDIDPHEIRSMRESILNHFAIGESVIDKRRRFAKIVDIPYFGRIDFQEKSENRPIIPVYIGIHTFHDTESRTTVIYDWRAPISSMFYDHELGEASYQSPSGGIKGDISLKRQYRIRAGKMEFMIESTLTVHDDILQKFLPFHLGGLKIAREYVHQAADGRRYLCVHGDGFDAISTNHRWLAMLGSLGYDVLLMVNRFYNKYRAWRGREYYSVSRAIKGRVKSAVNFIGKYEEQLQRLAVKRQCDGIIAGHVHHPADTMVGKVRYLNCGDWVETMSAVLEYGDGRMETVLYKDFMKRLAYGKCGTMEDAETSPGTGDS